MEKINKNEFNYIKAKNEQVLKDYDKLYNEMTKIDKAIIDGVLGVDINVNEGFRSAKELKEENDKIFERNLK